MTTIKEAELEEEKHRADILESKRISGLNIYQSQLFALRKQELDGVHAENLKRVKKSTGAMIDISAILHEMERRGFQFPAGEVENNIKSDAESKKFIADKRAGKHL